MSSPTSRITLAVLTLFATATTVSAWTPGTGSPDAVQGFTVTPTDRTDVLAFYNTVYAASEDFAATMAWTGDIAAGNAGTTSAVFKDDVRRRINFYRALGGLPADITFDAAKSTKDQAAALMFSANHAISHTPPTSWTFYTAAGAEAAGNSNISLGVHGPEAVDGFVRDDGANNVIVGHRRWFLYSRAQIMGTGDVPYTSATYPAANAVWVIGDFKTAPAPQFVAWPNRGYCPFALLPARWSLSYPGANFAAATVTLTQGGNAVPVTVISRTDNGYGDNTLVWAPDTLPTTIAADLPYHVAVAGITGSGVPTAYSYDVTIFDPDVLGDSVAIAGSDTPSTTGATYTFNPIAQADAYQLRVSTASATAWNEGAEDATAALIEARTTGSYALRQNATVRTGSKSFHLAFPEFADQSFVILRDLIPTATSQLQFFDRGFFATTTTTLAAEVSTDNGNTWTGVWSRNGVGLSSANWDPAYNSRSVALSAYAGKLILVRFILRHNGGSTVINTDTTCGFFLDDITVTAAAQLVGTTVTTLSGSATSFVLDATTAGSALIAGNAYILRLRPNVGTRWFGDGALKTVTVAAANGYATWAAAQTPPVTGGPLADQDNDGLTNGIEYAFGLNPVTPTSAGALPAPTLSGGNFGFTYVQPAGVSGVAYGAQWSTDLVTWTAIPDSGSGTTHTFTVGTAGRPRLFFRHIVTVTP